MTAAIEVLRLHYLAGAGSLKAFLDIRVGAVEIRGCKVVQQDGQKAWLALPSTKSSDGKWSDVVVIQSKDLKARMTAVALEAWAAEQ